ncbi:MAG: AAA family ATPase [Nocardioides sp.]
MTSQLWVSSQPLAVVRADEFLDASSWLDSMRPSDASTAASGCLLVVEASGVLMAVTDGDLLAFTRIGMPSGTENALALVPGTLAQSITEMLSPAPDDQVEFALTADGGKVLARLVSAPESSVVQGVWDAQAHIDLYNELVAGAAVASIVRISDSRVLHSAVATEAGSPRVVVAATPSGLIFVGSKPHKIQGKPEGALFRVEVSASHFQCAANSLCGNGGRTSTGIAVSFSPTNSVLELKPWSSSSGDRDDAAVLLRTGAVLGWQAPAAPAPQAAELVAPKPAEDVDAIFAEIDALPGLADVKQHAHRVRQLVRANEVRTGRGLRATPVVSPLLFAGQPGTGKSHAARVLARLYRALGVLGTDNVIEVNRTSLLDNYINQGQGLSARELIDTAVDGVLFIDDAYALTKEEDNDAIQSVVQSVLDAVAERGGEFLCIVSGTDDEMEKFLDSKTELRSTFRQSLSFPAYEPDELVAVAKQLVVETDNYFLDDALDELASRLHEHRNTGGFGIKGWESARTIHHIIEAAIAERDIRISAAEDIPDDDAIVTITRADAAKALADLRIGRAGTRVESAEDVLAELDALVGQPQLKQQIRSIQARIKTNQARESAGQPVDDENKINLVFAGPPGTGKTTVARLIARLYRALGVLPSDEIVEVGHDALKAGFKGQSETKTSAVFDRAEGGTLFIDEAYQLTGNDGRDEFGLDAVAVMIRRMDRPGSRAVIIAGYPDELDIFLGSNPGLERRFPPHLRISFSPYTAGELLEIGQLMLRTHQNTLTPDAHSELRDRLEAAEEAGLFGEKGWGNAGAIDTLMKAARAARDLRISTSEMTIEALKTVTKQDVSAACDAHALPQSKGIKSQADDLDAVLAELDSLIGQPQVKSQVIEILAAAQAANRRFERGLDSAPPKLTHLEFVGPPGTGKTTVARLIGRLYAAAGLLSPGGFVEVDRSDLVAQHVGQTAPLTGSVIDRALGGVLFIDEAYSLARGGPQDFGLEAIDTLVKRLTDDEGEFLTIIAGYPDEIAEFLASNSGLESRFGKTIEFGAYSAAELTQIAVHHAQRSGQSLAPGCLPVLATRLAAAEEIGMFERETWGNARSIIAVVDSAIQIRDTRIYDKEVTDADLITLRLPDVVAACDRAGLPKVDGKVATDPAVSPDTPVGRQPQATPEPASVEPAPIAPVRPPIEAPLELTPDDRVTARAAISAYVGEAVRSLAPGAAPGTGVPPGPALAALGVAEVYWQGGSGMGFQMRSAVGSKDDPFYYFAGGSSGRLPDLFWHSPGGKGAKVRDLSTATPHRTLAGWQESDDSLAEYIVRAIKNDRSTHG